MLNQDAAIKRLRSWMELENITTLDVADRTGIHRSHILKVISGATPISPSFCWKFGQAYGFDLARKLFDNQREPA